MKKQKANGLKETLSKVLWEYDVSTISWSKHRDFIIKRILHGNSSDAIRWLRNKVGENELRSWLIEHHGAGLDARRIRFWELMLDIPRRTTNRWIANQSSMPWTRRTAW